MQLENVKKEKVDVIVIKLEQEGFEVVNFDYEIGMSIPVLDEYEGVDMKIKID